MKKIVLFFIALVAIGCSKDDDTVDVVPVISEVKALKVFNKLNSTEIKDGDVVVINSNSSTADANALKFYFKNTSSASINVRTKIVSVTGTPDVFQSTLCIGDQCYGFLNIGSFYPTSADNTVSVPANGSVGENFFKFSNDASPVAPATKIDYVLEVYQFDSNGNAVGNKVKFTYRYQP